MMNVMAVVLLVLATLSSSLVDSRHIIKRSDDPNSLETVVMSLSETVNQLKAQQTALKAELELARRHSAFLAQFAAPRLTATYPSTPLKYDHIIFNDGSNYDPGLGVFTAPFSGVYVFCVKTFTGEHEHTRPAVDIVRNGQTVDRMAYDYLSSQSGHGGDSHSMSLTLRLTEGDRVWVQMVSGSAADELYGGFHTSFSGALIYSD